MFPRRTDVLQDNPSGVSTLLRDEAWFTVEKLEQTGASIVKTSSKRPSSTSITANLRRIDLGAHVGYLDSNSPKRIRVGPLEGGQNSKGN